MDWHTAMGFRADRAGLRDKKVDRAVMRRVFALARPYRGLLVGFLVTVIASSVTAALPPLLLRSLLDSAVPQSDRTLVTWLALGAVGLALAGAALSMIQRWCSAKVGEGLIFDLRASLFDHVQRMPLAFFTRTQTGALQSRLNNDVVGAQQAVTNTLGTVVSNLVTIVVTLSIMLRLEWRLTLLTLAVLPAFVYPARKVGPKLRTITRESMDLNATMNQTIAERFNVAGALLVKLFGRRDDERRVFEERAGRVRDIGVQSAMYGRLLFAVLGLVASVGTAIVFWIGGNLVISGAITAGTVAAFALYVQQIYTPLTQLTNARVDVLTALVSFERVFEVLDFEPAIADRPGAVGLDDPRGKVELDRVWFRHPSPELVSIPSLESPDGVLRDQDAGDWILRDVSLTVEPGETVALVGPSGAGKTTIAMLVARIHDAVDGRVLLDDHDVRDLTLDAVHATLGLVAQDPHLFHDTIRENLHYARPEATDAELVDALRAARIWDLVASLPEGLDTVVGERGYRMSGGEKQRLAIARMLLKDPAVVILDEATSHLDAESEVKVQRALATALEGRTALVIAHRLSTVRAADRIFVVDGGRIVEVGTHDELLAAEGLYAELTRTQLGRAEEPA